jgi:hypothetical protein
MICGKKGLICIEAGWRRMPHRPVSNNADQQNIINPARFIVDGPCRSLFKNRIQTSAEKVERPHSRK